MERWESSDDLTLIMGALMNMDAKVDEVVDHVLAIRRLLESDDEEEEEEA